MYCFLGHDHTTRQVVASVQDRSTLGKKRLDRFHCDQQDMNKCGGDWGPPMDLETAEILELVPCRTCFPEAWRKYRQRRGRPS